MAQSEMSEYAAYDSAIAAARYAMEEIRILEQRLRFLSEELADLKARAMTCNFLDCPLNDNH